jgi:hypothetical protein
MLIPALLALAAPAPTFNQEVAPILHKECASCHRPGAGGPFPLLTYADAKKRGKLLATVTKSRQMPPWKADRGDVPLKGERRLAEKEIDLIARWVEAGMPQGEGKPPELPVFSSEWALGKPDLVVTMPRAYKVPAEGRDIYRNFAIPLGLTEDKWVRAIDFRPSARSVVHHSLFFLDPTGESSKKEKASGQVGFSGSMGGAGVGGGLGALLDRLRDGGGLAGGRAGLGGWAQGAQARSLPEGLAYRVPKGSDLILSTHFHPSGKAEEERSSVALYFADSPPTRKFTGLQLPFGFGILAGINIPAGTKDFVIEDSFVLPADARAFGVSAHAHYIAKTFKLTATPPGGKPKVLLSISDWDFAWQEQYAFRDYVLLPKGTKLDVRITYDNSADNPRNPTNPPRRVRWGRESLDEMGSMTLQVVAEDEAGLSAIRDAYQKHVRASISRRGKLLPGKD